MIFSSYQLTDRTKQAKLYAKLNYMPSLMRGSRTKAPSQDALETHERQRHTTRVCGSGEGDVQIQRCKSRACVHNEGIHSEGSVATGIGSKPME